jgi:hypothetical protein
MALAIPMRENIMIVFITMILYDISSHDCLHGTTLLQVYLARFNIAHTIRHAASTKFSNLTPPTFRLAVIVAEIALRVFVADVQTFIADTIHAEIDKDLALHDNTPNEGHKRRIKALKKWTKARLPLSYDENAYEHLVVVLVANENDFGQGLPMSRRKEISIQEFARLLYSMGKPESPGPIVAPLIKKGSFPAINSVAISHIILYAGSNELKVQEHFTVNALITAANALKIQYVPWSRDHIGTGRPSTKPVHDVWISLGKTSTPVEAVTRNPMNQLQEATARAMRNDTRSPWILSELKLSELQEMFNKSLKPLDWDIKYASLNQMTDQIVRETYKWVNNNLNPQKPTHQLALIVAAIIAKLAPKISWPNDLIP